MKRRSLSQAIWEMQIKTMITPIRLSKIKNLRMASIVSDGEQWKFWYTTEGSVNQLDLFCQPFPVADKVEVHVAYALNSTPGKYLTKTLPIVHKGHEKRFIAEFSLITKNSQGSKCLLP